MFLQLDNTKCVLRCCNLYSSFHVSIFRALIVVREKPILKGLLDKSTYIGLDEWENEQFMRESIYLTICDTNLLNGYVSFGAMQKLNGLMARAHKTSP